MKKYLFFTISFLLIFMILQVLSGLILTAAYAPDFSGHIGGTLSNEVIFVQRSEMPLMIIAAISAVSAYFILNKVSKNN
ncbi:hypothetical protein EI200_13670 [Peribacillus simplex]|uniref:hypothetical protein n=1 Tax=Peribacillus simplex TaxID=1478 RepID=UPI000F631BB4|nr:hypothetical protein [Peribacillus simplex]RRN70514.1 hypothetical protein EI200_13670 [Peribacillus simplex]